MTIRHRLSLSFAAVLSLFAVSLAVYVWSAHLRTVAMHQLDKSLEREVLLSSLRQDLDNVQKEVALLSEIDVQGEQDSQQASNGKNREFFHDKLNGISQQIAALEQLSDSSDRDALAEVRSTYFVLKNTWSSFFDYFGVEPTWAIASAIKADPLSRKLQIKLLPLMQAKEKERVRVAQEEFAHAETITNRISTITFIFTAGFGIFVAVALSRKISTGFATLQHGTDLIGNMDLEHRIPIAGKDELGNFARSFNKMAERLGTATAEIARKTEEIQIGQERELKLAATIQQGLMAVRIPELAFASIRARNISCVEIGGDFYDVIPTQDGVAVVVCDVSGKGISAAILASMLQGMIRYNLSGKVSLAEIAAEGNRFLTSRDVAGKYAVLCILHLKPGGEVDFLNCGSVAPALVSEGGCRRLEANNLPVGLLAFAEYQVQTFKLRPGEKVVMVTDGVTEAARADDEMFGDDRLEAAVVEDDSFENVFSQVLNFCGETPLNDDCTVLEICYKGAQVARSAASSQAVGIIEVEAGTSA